MRALRAIADPAPSHEGFETGIDPSLRPPGVNGAETGMNSLGKLIEDIERIARELGGHHANLIFMVKRNDPFIAMGRRVALTLEDVYGAITYYLAHQAHSSNGSPCLL